MQYTSQDVQSFVAEEDVRFIHLAFCDVFGRQKNIAILPSELPRAFSYGIAIDASAIRGFGGQVHSDLFLHPLPQTLTLLPWRPEQGKLVQMQCKVSCPDGSPFENDTRSLLIRAVEEAGARGLRFSFGAELEFYLFCLDDQGNQTRVPVDHASYMDSAPDDRGEGVRREICMMLQELGIQPEGAHHEEGPGQNEIDFRYSDALSAADNAMAFRRVVKTVAARNGLWADFSPRPLINTDGSGMHINLSAAVPGMEDSIPPMVAGILSRIRDMTLFLNRTDNSYSRLGCDKAPGYATWSEENRSQLIRIPAAWDEYRRLELRSPDPAANPYLAFTLILQAAMEGITETMTPPAPCDEESPAHAEALPRSLEESREAASNSSFILEHVPQRILQAYCQHEEPQFYET